MSVNETPLEANTIHTLHCTRCNTPLPKHATFCGHCGARVSQETADASAPDHADITARYRIKTLARRQPYSQLYFGLDTQQQQRPVVIHDIDISSLDDQTRAHAIEALQEEYDLLRTQRIPSILPLIDLRYYDKHLYVIANWFATPSKQLARSQLFTLQDLLQSGLGLPDEQIAIAWTYRLSRALEHLHKNEVLIGNLDPQAIVVHELKYDGEPALIMSWLPELLRELLPLSFTQLATPFVAPEVAKGEIEPRSDVYSLGAILYLLLTGSPPEDAQTRSTRPLRSPREIDTEIAQDIDSVVMQALSLEKTERFQSASDLAEALLQLLIHPEEHQQAMPTMRLNKPATTHEIPATPALTQSSSDDVNILSAEVDSKSDNTKEDEPHSVQDDATILVVPLQAQMARRYLSKLKSAQVEAQEVGEALVEEGNMKKKKKIYDVPNEEQNNNTAPTGVVSTEEPLLEQEATAEEHTEQVEPPINELEAKQSDDVADLPTRLVSRDDIQDEQKQTATPAKEITIQRFKDILTGSLPALPKLIQTHRPVTKEATESEQIQSNEKSNTNKTFLQRIRQFLLGEQQYVTSAAALIETPMRIQPNQSYTIRINVMGRSSVKSADAVGLSSLVEGDSVHVEVRSALYQNYAYVVQKADVTVPATGYVAEVTMPMQALTSGPSGRRERLHVFFMDEARNPLYEKPFVIEVFISHLVQNGREGHNVLSIPI